jgi:hypothetical protein
MPTIKKVNDNMARNAARKPENRYPLNKPVSKKCPKNSSAKNNAGIPKKSAIPQKKRIGK